MRDKGRALGDRAVEMKHVAEVYCTLYPTLYTLSTTFYNLSPRPTYTLYPMPNTLRPTLYSPHVGHVCSCSLDLATRAGAGGSSRAASHCPV
jgi:hypothetical protein